ncbi:MAG: TIGR03619 family F420-dependent LLM class oxidoreductase [Pseudomonadales bacterium]|nr:TIGR03619 family F420-dependent LLM class oxidoreductase [Pseudomonadales bacterium]
MKISVVFPNVLYREGPEGVLKLIKAIEAIGYDELDMFDHVVMGHPTETRRKPFYSPTMPILEAFMVLSYAAAATTKIGLGVGVLVLPQRQPTLVAKQVSTLDTLSGGRVRLGLGIGWQRSEFEALGEDYDTRGRRMDEAIDLMRAYWQDEHVNFDGTYYQANDMAMEPKPPQGASIPIWIGGTWPKSLKRVVTHGDGWLGMNAPGDPPLAEKLASLYQFAEELGRDPATIRLQMGLSPDALDREKRTRFYAEPQLLLDRALQLKEMGFEQTSIDCVPIFQQGYRTSDAMIEYLAQIHETLAPALAD